MLFLMSIKISSAYHQFNNLHSLILDVLILKQDFKHRLKYRKLNKVNGFK